MNGVRLQSTSFNGGLSLSLSFSLRPIDGQATTKKKTLPNGQNNRDHVNV